MREITGQNPAELYNMSGKLGYILLSVNAVGCYQMRTVLPILI